MINPINPQVLSVIKPKFPTGKILARGYDKSGNLTMIRLNSVGFISWFIL